MKLYAIYVQGFSHELFTKWAKARIYKWLTNPSLKAGVSHDFHKNRTLVRSLLNL